MKKNLTAGLFMLFLPLLSCQRQGESATGLIPFSEQVLADTTGSWYRILNRDLNRQGGIAVLGEAEENALAVTRLMGADDADNVDGRRIPDGLPDFAGETFLQGVDWDEAALTRGSGDDGALREQTVRAALAMVGQGAKMIVFSSSFLGRYGTTDLTALYAAAGRDLPVIDPVRALADEGLRLARPGERILVWTDSTTLRSGVWQAVAAERDSARFEFAVPDSGTTPGGQLAALLQARADASGQPVSLILVDGMLRSAAREEMERALEEIRGEAWSQTVLAPDCRFADALSALSGAVRMQMRTRNLFTHNVAAPALQVLPVTMETEVEGTEGN